MRTLIPLAFVAALACDATEAPAGATPTDDGRYLIEVDAPEVLVAGTDLSFDLHLTDDAGTPATGLDVAVEPWMPGHGHGIANNPDVYEHSDGTYKATFAFNMPGSWELRVSVDDGEAESLAVFTYEVD